MASALLCFVSRFRPVDPTVRWHCGPHDDLVAAMPDKGWHLDHREDWMARILAGVRSASKLAREGALFGRPDAVQPCNLAFAAPLPWVAEHF
jgi:hypothetical protein